MPWDKNENLPEGVKVLPSEAQTIWRNAANSAISSGKDEETAIKIGWGAIKNAGWAKEGDVWKKMAKLYDLDIEIFSTGTWNGDDYDEKDLSDIAKNFESLKDKVKPPVKLGHNMSSKINRPIEDGQPALGWVKSIKRVGSKLLATLTQVPEVVYNAIKEGRYKRVSAEIYWNFKQEGRTYNRVLKAIALLGADTPAVDNLEDLAAYLTAEGTAFEKLAAYDFHVTEEGEIQNFNHQKEIDKMEKKEYEDKIAQLTDKITSLEERGKSAVAEISQLRQYKKDQEEAAKENDLKSFRGYLEDLVKAGRMKPATRDSFLAAEQKLNYTEGAGFSIPLDLFKAYADSVDRLIEFDEKGRPKDKDQTSSYDHAPAEVDRRAQELMAKGTVKEYALAVREVLSKDPVLAKAYADYNKD